METQMPPVKSCKDRAVSEVLDRVLSTAAAKRAWGGCVASPAPQHCLKGSGKDPWLHPMLDPLQGPLHACNASAWEDREVPPVQAPA